MPVVRTYACDCGHQWTEYHSSSDDAYPDCPICAASEPKWVPQPLRITGDKSRAIDYAQQVAEEDYGLSNMKDNTRAGEAAAMGPAAETTAERESRAQREAEAAREVGARMTSASPEVQQAVKQFWGGAAGANPAARINIQAAGAQGAALARSEGRDPMAMLHKGLKSGSIPQVKGKIVARG